MKKILFTLALLLPSVGKAHKLDCSLCDTRACCHVQGCMCTNVELDSLAREMAHDELLKRQAAGENISQNALDYYSKD